MRARSGSAPAAETDDATLVSMRGANPERSFMRMHADDGRIRVLDANIEALCQSDA
jgi:hypothetical protein